MLASPTLRVAASLVANAPPMRVAIVGSGPSGFYAAARLLQSFDAKHGTGTDGTEIHMYERLPTPFGLVRYGVAPDHPEVRNVESKFDQVARDPRFSFFGNVRVTEDDAQPPISIYGPNLAFILGSLLHTRSIRLRSVRCSSLARARQ